MARAEVKNYLAELAEESNLPFYGPAAFLRGLRIELTNLGAAGSADSPFGAAGDITLFDESGGRLT
jgi:hypothetical protein